MIEGEMEALFVELVERMERLEARVEALEGKPKRASGEKSDGSLVFEAYSKAYEGRYGTPPVRNAKMNGIAKLIVSRVGKELGIALVDYFLTTRDQFYVTRMHPLDLCLKDCETLVVRMKTGIKVTVKQAQQIEDMDGNAQAAKAHLARKYGKR